jgi:single-stranded DNA-binding protein
MPEYKRYDSEDNYTCEGVRLAKDPEVKEVGDGNIVTLTFVSTSRNEGDSDLWVEAKIADRQADLAAYLKKDDVLHAVKGKPCLRRYGDKNEKFSFQLRRAAITVPIGMFATIKDRGWSPGAASPKNNQAKNPPRGARRAPAQDFGADEDIPF